jgi:hypothetical protein
VGAGHGTRWRCEPRPVAAVRAGRRTTAWPRSAASRTLPRARP